MTRQGRLSVVILLLLAVWPRGSQASAGGLADVTGGCTDAALQGAYGFAGKGLLAVDTTAQPVVLLGVASFDGAGGGNGQVQINAGTRVVATSFGALHYIVNADCTGTVSIANGPRASFVVVEGGQELDVQETDGLGNVTGIAEPLLQPCSDASLSSSYAVSASGWLVPELSSPALQNLLPIGTAGLASFDGNGNVTVVPVSVDSGGQRTTEDMLTGSYAVDADCSGMFTAGAGTPSREQESLVVVNGGSEAWFISTDPQSVVLGTLKAQ